MEIPENPNEVEEMQQGREAEFILNHPMVKGAIDAMEAYYAQAWMRTEIGDRDEREMAFGMLKCVQAFRSLLTEYVETGTMAAVQKDSRTQQQG